jgi:hypothetical protein
MRPEAPTRLRRPFHIVLHSQLEDTLQGLLERQAQLKQEQERLQRLVHAEQCAPKADWAHDSFPWDQQVQQLMHGVFGLKTFRQVSETA